MRIKKFEAFHITTPMIFDTAAAVIWLFGKFVYLPYRQKKEIMDRINDPDPRSGGFTVEIDGDNVIFNYDTYTDGLKPVFELDKKNRLLKYTGYKLWSGEKEKKPTEIRLSKSELDKLMNSIRKTRNIRDELENLFQDVTDGYYYKAKIRRADVNLENIIIDLERPSDLGWEHEGGIPMGNGMVWGATHKAVKKFTYQDDIHEFPEVLLESIERIEGEYNVKLCGFRDLETPSIGKTNYIYRKDDFLWTITKIAEETKQTFFVGTPTFNRDVEDEEEYIDDRFSEKLLSNVSFLGSHYRLVFKKHPKI